MTRKIRIAQIITGLGHGGAEQALLGIARHIDRTRFDVDIYCVIEGGALVSEFEKMGFLVKVIPNAYDFSKINPYRIRKILLLCKLLKRGRYDLVHTHLYAADVIGRIAAIFAGIPCIVKSLHNMGTWKKEKHLLVDKILSLWTSKVICCSAYLRQSAIRQEKLHSDKVTTIYHGVEVDRFAQSIDKIAYSRMIALDPRKKTVGTIGRLIDLKGHVHLLDAIPMILEQHPDTQFLIVGDGPLRDHLIRKVQNKSYQELIFFTGSRNDVPELLNLMDVFVFPSLSEGLGISVLEAMAARLPVVASNIGPISEMVVGGETGLLVDSGNPVALAMAVRSLLADDTLRQQMGARGLDRITKHFSHSAKVGELQQLYLDLCASQFEVSSKIQL